MEDSDFYIALIEDSNLIGKLQITKQQSEEFRLCCYEVREIHRFERLHDIVVHNYLDFLSNAELTLTEIFNGRSHLMGPKEDKMNKTYFRANRIFLNFLSSFGMFIDHCKTSVTRRFGKSSEEIIQLEKILSGFFDNHFCYRFLLQLRNYSLHCGLPITSIGFIVTTQQNVATLHIRFDPQELLQDYSGWNRIVKNDLENMTEPFDVLPLAGELMQVLTQLIEKIKDFNISRIVNAAHYINNLTYDFRHEQGEVRMVVFKPEGDDNCLKMHTYRIPFDTVDEILGQ